MNLNKTIQYLKDAIPQGPHPTPHAEWIGVRLDVVQAAIHRLSIKEKKDKPVGRILHWRGPAHYSVPHGGICVRTYDEFPTTSSYPENKGSFWEEGLPVVVASLGGLE